MMSANSELFAAAADIESINRARKHRIYSNTGDNRITRRAARRAEHAMFRGDILNAVRNSDHTGDGRVFTIAPPPVLRIAAFVGIKMGPDRDSQVSMSRERIAAIRWTSRWGFFFGQAGA